VFDLQLYLHSNRRYSGFRSTALLKLASQQQFTIADHGEYVTTSGRTPEDYSTQQA